jgi:hypothetical protein
MRTRANPLFALQVLSVSDIVKPRRTNRPALAAAREPAELHAHSAHIPRSATMQAARSSTDDCQGPLQRLPRGASFDRSRRAPRVPGLPTAACGLLLCDTSGRIVAGNPHGLRLLQEAELRGHPLRRDLQNGVLGLLDDDITVEQWSPIHSVSNDRTYSCSASVVELSKGGRILAVLLSESSPHGVAYRSTYNEHNLTPREYELALLLSNGFTNKELAARPRGCASASTL